MFVSVVFESLCDGCDGRDCIILAKFCLSDGDGERLDWMRFVLGAAGGSLVFYCYPRDNRYLVTGIHRAFSRQGSPKPGEMLFRIGVIRIIEGFRYTRAPPVPSTKSPSNTHPLNPIQSPNP